jgi:trehalose 6-phosphate phosphatase
MQLGATQVWSNSIRRRLNRPWALFLDFDGTLTPIAPRPEQVLLDPSQRRLVSSLARWVPVTIISGRALLDLRSRVDLKGLTYAGNHGLEIVGPGFRYRMQGDVQWRRFLKGVLRRLQDDLEMIPGILLEDKKYTISVHYRLTRRDERKKAARLFAKRVKPFRDQGLVRVTYGKAVWEIRPTLEWDKGRAVQWILKQAPFRGRWPLYIGDDETDQDAFRRIRKRGVGIAVGPPEKKGAADYTIQSPKEVRGFLEWLLYRLSRRGTPLKKVLS